MIDVKKFLDQEGIATLWSEISDNFIDVDELAAVINAIDKAKADKADIIDWSTYEFITIEDINAICNATSDYTITYNLDGGKVASGGGGLGSGDTIDWFALNAMDVYQVSRTAPTLDDLSAGYSITTTDASTGGTTTVTEADITFEDFMGIGYQAGGLVYIVPADVDMGGGIIPAGTYFTSNDTQFVSTFTVTGYSAFDGGDTIDWFVLDAMDVYQVSRTAPTLDDLTNGYSVTTTDASTGGTTTVTEADITFEDFMGIGYQAGGLVYIVPADVDMGGGIIPAGTYFTSNDTQFVSSFIVNGYTFGGSGGNPKTYTSESEDFTLINPTKKGYTFLGWTGSNGSTPETTVTIASGSTGNKEYTAVWEKNARAYAIYSADDNSLRFYYSNDEIVQGEDYNNLEATAVYDELILGGYVGSHGGYYLGSLHSPWYLDGNYTAITKVAFEDENFPATDLSGYFAYCSALEEVVNFPESVSTIGEFAFYECTGLSEIRLPAGLTEIGDSAFNGCTGLRAINIPSSVLVVGSYAFMDCTGLTAITIPEGVTSVGTSAFDNCTGLVSVSIPGTISSIKMTTFRGCTSLTSVTIQEGVTYIGNQAFAGCTSLAEITLPASLTSYWEGGGVIPNPSSEYIPGADGYWYNAETGEKHNFYYIPTGVAATYVAVKPAVASEA